MWKFQHSTGQREINELHVPVGRKIKLTMTTEDVLHDVFIPAFRTKADVVPGRYTTLWFEATTPGKYHLYCAEYCGLNHSGMGGWVYVMPQQNSMTGLPAAAQIKRRSKPEENCLQTNSAALRVTPAGKISAAQSLKDCSERMSN